MNKIEKLEKALKIVYNIILLVIAIYILNIIVAIVNYYYL